MNSQKNERVHKNRMISQTHILFHKKEWFHKQKNEFTKNTNDFSKQKQMISQKQQMFSQKNERIHKQRLFSQKKRMIPLKSKWFHKQKQMNSCKVKQNLRAMAASCRLLPTSASSGRINFDRIVVELLSKERETREARMKDGRRREGGTIKNSEFSRGVQ